MNRKVDYNRLLHALIQVDLILVLFLWLFQIAPHSVYSANWTEEVNLFVRNCNLFNFAAFTLLFIGTVFCVIKSGCVKRISLSVLFPIIIFLVHILIRVNMLGSYQVSDAKEYFTRLEAVAYYPQGILFNPLKSGFICGHIAQGFIFLSMLGQLLNVESGMGFQYSNMVLGAAAAVCLYYIFKRVFPKAKPPVCAIAAFIVSIQPMFLGLSTSAQMEYPLAVLFIFVLCAYVTKHYILMGFWLVLLGTCKETGTMMAFSVLGFASVYGIIDYVKKSGGIRKALKNLKVWHYILIAVFVAACIFVFIKVLYIPVWGGKRIIDVLKIGGEGRMNFQFEKTHFLLKARQLYILNFSWLWAIILILGLIINFAVPAIRNKKLTDGRIISFIIIQYLVYTGFLLFFLEAKGTRYNILSDALFLFLTMTVVIKVLDKLVMYIPACLVIGGLAFVEAFLTIDPVSRAVFTQINTGGIPMVWTAATKSEMSYMDINIGDYGYYNYQYTFPDRAVDKMLDEVDYQGWYRIVSSFDEGVEDQFANPSLIWDSELRKRTYRSADEDGRYHQVLRISCEYEVDSWDHDHRCIYVELPFCKNNTEKAKELLSDLYIFDGPYTVTEGWAGSLTYYILYLK